MTLRRLAPVALVVAALVAVVALVARGRPLAASAGKGGLPSSFWDFTLTTSVIVVVLFGLVVLATLLSDRQSFAKPQNSSTFKLLPTLLGLLLIGFALAYAERHALLHRLLKFAEPGDVRVGRPGKQGTTPPPSGGHFIWMEAVVVFGLVLVLAGIFAITRQRKHGRPPALWSAPEAVAASLDVSLDDLRTDPDLRRAIVAAYARMEAALGATGLPRHPAETPLEYLERALLSLDTSGPAVRRLTDLFQWAKFSHHDPEPSMRDEAVDALEAVRDALRARSEVAA